MSTMAPSPANTPSPSTSPTPPLITITNVDVDIPPAPDTTRMPPPHDLHHSPSPVTIDTLTWDKVDVDSNENVVRVVGVRFTQLSSKQLRTVCSRLNIRGVKNAKKQVMIDNITAHYKNRRAYDSLLDSSPEVLGPSNLADSNMTIATRKEIQCPFRLMNILFSDQFAERFAATGNAATRDVLDTGMAGNDQLFWQTVRTAFVSPLCNDDYDELLFTDDIVLALQSDDIDLAKIVPHDWKKLRGSNLESYKQ